MKSVCHNCELKDGDPIRTTEFNDIATFGLAVADFECLLTRLIDCDNVLRTGVGIIVGLARLADSTLDSNYALLDLDTIVIRVTGVVYDVGQNKFMEGSFGTLVKLEVGNLAPGELIIASVESSKVGWLFAESLQVLARRTLWEELILEYR